MRIRNSRTSMPILPLAHETVPNTSRFRTRGPLINDDVLLQEVLQRKSESGSTSRSSNCSRAQRDAAWSTISPKIVLALPKYSRPTLVSDVKTPSISKAEKEVSYVKSPSISESAKSNGKASIISIAEKELPLKKRMHYRLKVEKKDKHKQENTTEKKGVKKRKNAAVTKMNMDAPMMCQDEGSGETDGGRRDKSICRILNCESFIPCPVIDGIREQGKAEELLRHEGDGLEKQRKGQPKNKLKRSRKRNSGLKKSRFILD